MNSNKTKSQIEAAFASPKQILCRGERGCSQGKGPGSTRAARGSHDFATATGADCRSSPISYELSGNTEAASKVGIPFCRSGL